MKWYPDYDKENKNTFEDEKESYDNDKDYCQKINPLKSLKSTRNQIHGIFVGCCMHSICYGFHLMETPEGRKDFFYVLYKYWSKEKIDSTTFIYDFFCSALEYMLNREPLLFQNIWGKIDKFHSGSHKCSELYDIRKYLNQKATGNTSIMESLNSFLSHFKSQTAYMKQETFIKFLKVILGFRNYFINTKLQNKKLFFSM